MNALLAFWNWLLSLLQARPQPQPPPSGKKKWTFMVYMGGDNGSILSSLEGAGYDDLAEMKQVGSTDQVNVLAQFDRLSDHSTRRYYVIKGGNAARDEVANLGETNTGDPQVLRDFIAWAAGKYPADHYALVLWNHGSGWKEDDIYGVGRRIGLTNFTIEHGRGPVGQPISRALFSTTVGQSLQKSPTRQTRGGGRGILYDDSAKDFLDNAELSNILDLAVQTLGRKVDLLGMDACLMNMLEVAYQSRQGANVMVGSQETEPGAGWPYQRVLAALRDNPEISAQDLSTTVVREYAASYREAVTQSALDLGRVEAAAAAVDALAAALMAGLGDAATRKGIDQARRDAQKFYDRDYLDLYHLATLLQKYCPAEAIRTSAQGVLDAIQPAGQASLVLEAKSVGSTMAESHGVSIYFPDGRVSSTYAGLDMSTATRWDEFLTAYSRG